MLRGTIRRRPLLVEEVDEFGGFIVVVLLVTGVKQSQLLYLSEEIQNKFWSKTIFGPKKILSTKTFVPKKIGFKKGAVHGWFHEAFLAAILLFLPRLG